MNQPFTYSGTATLEILHDALNYNRYLEEQIAAFIAPETHALDFGAGIGEFAQRLHKRGIAVDCVELDDDQRAHMETIGLHCFRSIEEAPNQRRIYSLNVLEHIEDDVAALEMLHGKLESGGKLLLYVPAFMCLFTAFDKHVGHHRRYTRGELMRKVAQAGFRVEHCRYVDCVGFICWFFMGRLPGNQTTINPFMIKLFDRILFPASVILDRIFGKHFGKNLLLVARKV